jgi:hypothetical protein
MKVFLPLFFIILGLSNNIFAQIPFYVPTNGLVGWWPFTGNANDLSVNGNNGTVNGATLTVDRFGVVNSAYNFDGINDNIDIGNLNLGQASQSFTVSVWFKTIVSPSGYGYLISDYSSFSGGDNIFSFHLGQSFTNGTVYFDKQNMPSYFFQSQTLAGLDQWNNIVIVSNASTGIVQFYLNGSYISQLLVNSSTVNNQVTVPYYNANNNFSSGQFFRFGCDLYNGILQEFYNGSLDDIGIWNRALTLQEITDLYNACQFSSVYAGLDQTICNGDPVTLSAINSLNYSWDNGVADGVAFNPTATQDYTVSADSAGCISTDVVTVTVNEHTIATQTETALDSYTWPINSQTYTQSGTYIAVIPNEAGCDSTITLDLSLDFTGLEDNSQGALFSIFPNPAQSIINVNTDNKLIGDAYFISDNSGRIVLTGKLNSQNTTIELGNLSGGIYMFRVGDHMKKTFKVLKE